MVFSSLPFLLLFLLVVLLVSHILPFQFRNFFLLLANLVFYAYGEPVYVLIMIGSILVNYFGGVLIEKQPTRTRKRVVLILGIVIVALCMPTATNATNISYLYGGNHELASSGVMLSTLLSMVTMPVLMQLLFG